MPSLPSLCLAVCALALLASARAARAECSAWPGEPDPLPRLGAADEFGATWAQLRREELRGLALLLEASDPVEARRLWLHAACLAPGDTEIAAALARTAQPAVRYVAVRLAPPAARVRRATFGAAFEVLAAEARVAPPEPQPDELGEFDFAPLDAQIRAAAEHLEQARFQAASDLSDLARARLVRLGGTHAAVRERRVRVELIGATARLALGQDQDARGCVERALRADPELELDPSTSPPKLQRLLSEARGAPGGHPR
jgi:hypothetical protein